MKVVIVDYGMGNILSIVGAMKYIGCSNISVSDCPQQLEKADKLILPGVGNFAKAITIIREKGLDMILNNIVIEEEKPILGICLGMQLLGISSCESGSNKGLGFIDGVVEFFPQGKVKIPHVGYNQVLFDDGSRLYSGIKPGADYYFTHSYRMMAHTNIGQSMCQYPDDFVASFEVGNIAGVQFHPELSQNNGLALLRNFIEKF